MQSDFSEKTLEDIIFENREVIHEKGFEVMLSNTFRQYTLPSGKRIDIVTFEIFEKDLLLYIIELKKNETSDALTQAYGYLSELLRLLKPMYETITSKVILVGRTVTDMPIADFLFSPTEAYTFKYGLNGLEFKMCYSNCDVQINDRKIKY